VGEICGGFAGSFETPFFCSRVGKLSDDKLREIEGGFNGRIKNCLDY
jgi:hypothetical protein